ncbi:MutS domain V [Clostridium amylolyticum]|uniref:MutS domain V n=1 Tax=Clostridium amylolyticum TaxID=1121298 RepID=A0A1M6MCC5_9CLOT|nr:MutS family DNA mismatch repair protein [Clostridium amylolyticum]SHJ81020.1 MutS domain V [Clostridium amylolyticum]
MNRALEHYTKREKDLTQKSQELKREINFYSIIRLVIFVGAAVVCFIAFKNGKYLYFGAFLTLFISLFILAAYKHSKVLEEKSYTDSMLVVIKRGLNRIEGNFKEFSDNGEEFIDKKHPYSYDLDIFGEGSLYQMINSTSTYTGKERLSKELQRKIKFSTEEILSRQEAITDLSLKEDYREKLTAIGIMNEGDMEEPKALLEWSLKREKIFSSLAFKIICYALNFITLGILVLMTLKIVDYKALMISLLINGTFLLLGKTKREEAFEVVNIYKNNINTYFRMLQITEEEDFQSNHMKALKNSLKEGDKDTVFQLKQLTSIVNRLKDTKNAYYLIINIFFLMDYHILFSLESWRMLYGRNIPLWLETLGEIEALSSLSIINYEHENWCIPKIVPYNILEGKQIGHPLLGKEVVRNDFSLKHPNSLVLVTGSNMSGKSTFLRTLGVNLLLSYLGSAVSAESFTCGIMDIYTCMRINDDLKESISSFYAELLRIKDIIAASKTGEPIFFLLDEIFKGTNSKDRHKGAEVLINQLSTKNALGLVSTHDLELTIIEQVNPKVANYHFREYYEDNKLKFDYKLRKGYSTTQNALYLMRMVGIEE